LARFRGALVGAAVVGAVGAVVGRLGVAARGAAAAATHAAVLGAVGAVLQGRLRRRHALHACVAVHVHGHVQVGAVQGRRIALRQRCPAHSDFIVIFLVQN